MKCPACDNQLEQRKIGEISVDVCNNGCGGIWFDHHELKQVDEQHEGIGEGLLHIKRNPEISVDFGKIRPCPRCDDVLMMKHYMSVNQKVEVDECANCGGIWLDAGELGQIRSEFHTEADREAAAKKYFAENFGDELKKMLEESEEKSRRALNIAKMFRFICPSYYIPGKQKWGAF